jgi:hypothetical protein
MNTVYNKLYNNLHVPIQQCVYRLRKYVSRHPHATTDIDYSIYYISIVYSFTYIVLDNNLWKANRLTHINLLLEF